ncbi:MAG: porin [Gammaproteobacteria bacterium]|nr:porin [Gammaproteobacteria bacterium]
MKKQLLAAAIAAAVAVPMTASAGDVTLYGVVMMSINDLDNEVNAGNPGGSANWDNGVDGLSVQSHFTRFGIKGTEDLGNGLSAFFQIEFHLADAENGGNLNNNRNTFVGLAGNWGKVGIGNNDGPYKKSTASLELFSVVQGDANQLGFEDVRLSDSVFYYSPNWNGFSFGAAITMPSVDANEDGVEGYSLAATYKNGPWFAALAVEDFDDGLTDHAATLGRSEDKWRLGLGYTANGFHVGYIYEDRDNIAGVDGADEDSWQLSGSYTFGNNVAKIAYGEENDIGGVGGVDSDMWSIGLDHKLSKRTKLYGVYADYSHDTAGNDWDSWGVGIVHKF